MKSASKPEDLSLKENLWEQRFKELKAFKRTHGHCRVPTRSVYPPNPELASWVKLLKSNPAVMSIGQLQKVYCLGFDFNSPTHLWIGRYLEVNRFKEQYGHLRIPMRYKPNLFLNAWLSRQRRGSIPLYKRQLLNRLGYEWKIQPKFAWEERFKRLKELYQRAGNVYPVKYDSLSMLSWAHQQRCKYKRGILSRERQKRLESLGFDWTPLSNAWPRQFNELLLFKKQFGHTRVPSTWKINPTLAHWVSHQRGHQHELSRERRKQLNDIGFEWCLLKKIWEKRFQELKDFKRKYGHCRVPQRWSKNKALAGWVHGCRRRKGKLSDEQKKRLEALEFDWGPQNTAWLKKLEEFQAFKAKFGHCQVPTKWIQNPSLGGWVTAQRDAWRRGTLSKERIRILDRLGFVWKPKARP